QRTVGGQVVDEGGLPSAQVTDRQRSAEGGALGAGRGEQAVADRQQGEHAVLRVGRVALVVPQLHRVDRCSRRSGGVIGVIERLVWVVDVTTSIRVGAQEHRFTVVVDVLGL